MQREADNGRLMRLLMKLCYICERPELGGDSQWAETGDRCGGGWRAGGRAGGVGATVSCTCLQAPSRATMQAPAAQILCPVLCTPAHDPAAGACHALN